MKKSIFPFILSAIILTSSTSFGALTADHLMLGKVQYGATINDVETIYGNPLKIERKTKLSGEEIEYKYDNSLEFEFVDGKLVEITADEQSNVKTKAGVGIGTDVKTLKSIYGEPDLIHEEDYIYYIDGQKNVGLKFEIKNGVVKEIKCGILD